VSIRCNAGPGPGHRPISSWVGPICPAGASGRTGVAVPVTVRLSALCVHARLPLPATVLACAVACRVPCRCLMDLKIRVLGARRGGTSWHHWPGHECHWSGAPGPGQKSSALTSVTAGTLLFSSRPEDGFRTVTPGLMPWASCCNQPECIQLRLLVHFKMAPTENAATLKIIIEHKGAGEQSSRDKAQVYRVARCKVGAGTSITCARCRSPSDHP
jgi:hypothetical protein